MEYLLMWNILCHWHLKLMPTIPISANSIGFFCKNWIFKSYIFIEVI